jgi:DNA-binding transcriptional LysR family regulator
MDLNLLVTFEALYRERNVTRAGRRLGLSQPATSAALARLRAMLGDELFTRTPGGLVPTERCEALAEPALRALSDLRAAFAPTEFDPRTSELAFRIGAVDAVVAVVLRAALARVMREAPRVRVDVVACTPSDAVPRLDARELDVAIAPLHPVPAHVGSRELFPLDLVVVMRLDHPLAASAAPSVDELLRFPHVAVRLDGPVRSTVDEGFARQGKERRIAVTLASFLAVPHVVTTSDALALVPGPFGRRLAADGVLACRPLPHALPQLDARMRLMWPARADRAPASRWLRSVIVDTVASELRRPGR